MKLNPKLTHVHDKMQKHSEPKKHADWAYVCEGCGAWVAKSKQGPQIIAIKAENTAASITELARVPGMKRLGKDGISGDIKDAMKAGYKLVNGVLICLELLIKNRYYEDVEALIAQLRHDKWDNTPARKCFLAKAPARLRKLRRLHAERDAKIKQNAVQPTQQATKA